MPTLHARWTVLLAAALFQILVLYVIVVGDLSPAVANRDVAQTAGLHPLVGVLSNLGALLWIASAAMCGLASVVLSRVGGDRRECRFFALASVLTTYIALDDFFMLHESLLPEYVGLPEKGAILLIVFGAAWCFMTSLRTIRDTPYRWLLAALGLLATSILIDGLDTRLHRIFVESLDVDPAWRSVIEDAPKWLGIACWFGYFADTAACAIVRAFETQREPKRAIGARSRESAPALFRATPNHRTTGVS